MENPLCDLCGRSATIMCPLRKRPYCSRECQESQPPRPAKRMHPNPSAPSAYGLDRRLPGESGYSGGNNYSSSKAGGYGSNYGTGQGFSGGQNFAGGSGFGGGQGQFTAPQSGFTAAQGFSPGGFTGGQSGFSPGFSSNQAGFGANPSGFSSSRKQSFAGGANNPGFSVGAGGNFASGSGFTGSQADFAGGQGGFVGGQGGYGTYDQGYSHPAYDQQRTTGWSQPSGAKQNSLQQVQNLIAGDAGTQKSMFPWKRSKENGGESGDGGRDISPQPGANSNKRAHNQQSDTGGGAYDEGNGMGLDRSIAHGGSTMNMQDMGMQMNIGDVNANADAMAKKQKKGKAQQEALAAAWDPNDAGKKGNKDKKEKPSFACTVEGCQRKYANAYALKYHIEKHNTEGPLACPFDGCTQKFWYKNDLSDHQFAMHADQADPNGKNGKDQPSANANTQKFPCTWEGCKKEYGNMYLLKYHMERHEQPGPLVCSWDGCNMRFWYKNELTNHTRSHAQQNNAAQTLGSNALVLSELKNGNNNNNNANGSMGKKNGKNGGMALTMVTSKGGRGKAASGKDRVEHPCVWEGCNKVYGNAYALKYHVEKHNTPGPLICPEDGCGGRFWYKTDFTDHTRAHERAAAEANGTLTGADGTIDQALKPKGQFPCTWGGCHKVYSSAYALKYHLQKHSSEGPLACTWEGCGKRFWYKSRLTAHNREHTGESHPYPCTWEGCGKSFVTKSELTVHTRKHSGERTFPCQVEGCEDKFSSRFNLNVHMRWHTDKGLLTCSWQGCADQRFQSQDSLAEHMRMHDASFGGTIIGDHSKEVGPVSRIKLIPNNPNMGMQQLAAAAPAPAPAPKKGKSRGKYLCPWDGCQEKFSSSTNLLAHFRTHTGEMVTCTVPGCGLGFALESELEQHFRGVHGLELYKCTWDGCSRTFISNQLLTEHLPIHSKGSGAKPFMCTFGPCQDKFATWYERKIHMITHARDRPYTCTYDNCDKTYASSARLKSHSKKHTSQVGEGGEEIDEHKFVCTVAGCGKEYLKDSTLANHMLKKHSADARII
ncbi:hypothetical protein SARC_01837 [Sphaeroforma arctica JP610]|uniref:C2H2-type domain-containing protein n=1 Tax=Sphaeroforma arctica JP610 TaxID=667725 RepID=A0A0L0GAD3_9EUKA|nr:hypothetical protein SARC_01837 [Sphaeroforma arctica JP610]KNC85992.1 hypothetical protein SARC_01837 [Sphaeroforma arctica JP610]|eukprot:XP_014159894.1 hypothetical protein SARC_01837 [Sphaeroforma arctica JP610]